MPHRSNSDAAPIRESPSQSAWRILADDRTWTKGDARVCAEFVLAAQAEFRSRLAEAREALENGPEDVAAYLRCGWGNGYRDCSVEGCQFPAERCIRVERERAS